jgi:cytochrome c oxidase accessory protein FixG
MEQQHNKSRTLEEIGVEILPVNAGQNKVHAKRIKGHFRTFKWITAAFWLSLFLGPYVRWNGEQAILWDVVNRQFHIFGLTILPQDIWMLSLVLLFFAILLAVTTAIAGRVWCGYFCFHTVWVDVFTWIEEKIEGQPTARQRLDAAPWTLEKLGKRTLKHSLWIVLAFLTAFSFLAYFIDVYELWGILLSGQVGGFILTELIVLGGLTYLAAGIMREQICLWVCPYARIQGAMIDTQTVVPTYDKDRGEPRSRSTKEGGDCVDCNLCVAVCPTGVDIRQGQQYGCITCGLCIDACDSVMEKIKKPLGLIRYASIEEFEGKRLPPLYRRPRVLVYSSIMAIAFAGILYGFVAMAPMTMNVLHERSPLFVQLSDGRIQNRYTVKMVNKTDATIEVKVNVSGIEGAEVLGDQEIVRLAAGQVTSLNLFVKASKRQLTRENTPLIIKVVNIHDTSMNMEYQSSFIGPRY